MAWLTAVARADGFCSTRVDIVSPLPRQECVRRLCDVVEGPFALFGSRPLVGHVEDTSFNLRKRIWYRNAFQTVARGTIEQESRQTRLRCRFGLHRFVIGFLIFWCGLVVFFGGGAIVHSSSGSAPPIDFGDLLLMLLFTALVVTIGRLFARNERRDILRILTQTLDVHEMP